MFSEGGLDSGVDLVEVKELQESGGKKRSYTLENDESSSSEGSIESLDPLLDDDPEERYRRSLFHLAGIGFLFLAVIFAISGILSTSLAYSSIDKETLKWVFGPFFSAFILALFFCLCCTYYFGAPSETWEVSNASTNLIKINFSNVVVLIGVIIEFVQITAFSFNKTLKFGGVNVGVINWVAIPVRDNTWFFSYVFWTIFFVAFTPWIFMSATRFYIYVYEQRHGVDAAEALTENIRPKFHILLWFLVNVLFFPVVGTMIAGADCTYRTSQVTLDANPSLPCFHGHHLAIISAGLLALIVYFPAAAFAQAQVAGISDIKFKPRVVFLTSMVKLSMAIFAQFFSSVYPVYYIAVFICNLLFVFFNFFGSPCYVRWVNRMRTVFLTLAAWATISNSLVWILDSQTSLIPVIVFLVGWGVMLLAFPTLFIVWGKFSNQSIAESATRRFRMQRFLDKFM